MQLEFSVTNQTLKRLDALVPVANSHGYLTAHFTLPDEYTGTVTAFFGKTAGNVMTSVPMTVSKSTGICIVPEEVLKQVAMTDIQMYVWLTCLDSSKDEFITTNHITVKVSGSGIGLGVNPLPESSVNQYEEIMASYNSFNDKVKIYSEMDVPQLFLTGNIAAATKETKSTLQFDFKSRTQEFHGYCTVKWQGTSSLAYPKKNYTIELFTDKTKSTKQKINLRDWGAQSKFCLKANYMDHSHARNVVSARIWGAMVATRENIPELMKKAPNHGAVDGFPVKVSVNGVLHGLYTWNIPKEGWMFDMDSSVSTHAILGAELHDGACAFRNNALVDGSDWSLEFPSTLNPAVYDGFNDMIDHVKDTTDEVFVSDFEKYLDLEACLDYYIYGFAITHLDGLGKNMLIATYDGVKWYPSMYDMDSTWGLYFDGGSFVPYTFLFPNEYQCSTSLLWERLKDNFPQQIYDRFMKLKSGPLSLATLIDVFENFMEVVTDKLYATDVTLWPLIPSKSVDHLEQIKLNIVKRMSYVESVINGYVHKNMFNKDMVTANIYVNTTTGAEVSDGSYYTSEFMAAFEGNSYTMSGGGWSRIAYYDKDENFLQGYEGNGPLTGFAPSYTRLVRVSFSKGQLNTVMLEHGANATAFAAYGE